MKCWTDFVKPLSLLLILSSLQVTPSVAEGPEPEAEAALLPFEYARVWQDPVPVYAMPGDPAQLAPIDTLLPPDSWVSIDETVQLDGQVWYRIDEQAYVQAAAMSPASPSGYHGLQPAETPQHPMGFVVAQELNVRSQPGTAANSAPVVKLHRYDTVDILETVKADDDIWHKIGEGRYVHGGYVRVLYPVARPADVPADERWIAVDLAQQVLSAYEGDRMVFATLVSTGRPPFFTPKGLYRIWVKRQAGGMEGGTVEKGDYYYLQDVPWVMYFARDVALHAAYWHDRFGYPSSHGCVNLSPLDAKWLFDWATPQLPFPDSSHVYASRYNPGTWVYVYASSG